MGTTADKITKAIIAQERSGVIDLSSYRAAKESINKAHLDKDQLGELLAGGYDPRGSACPVVYRNRWRGRAFASPTRSATSSAGLLTAASRCVGYPSMVETRRVWRSEYRIVAHQRSRFTHYGVCGYVHYRSVFAPQTAGVDVECPLQTAAAELAVGRRPACGRQKRRPPAAQSRSASLPMGHQPQPMLRRPPCCAGAVSGIGGSTPAKFSSPCASSRT